MGFEFQARPIDIDEILDERVPVESTAETVSAVSDILSRVSGIKLIPRPEAVASLDAELKGEMKP